MIIKGYIFGLLYGLFCIALSAIAHKSDMKVEYTRKITHILVGFEWFILNHYFGANMHFLIICLIFTFLVAIIHKTNLVPGMSSNADNSRGTIYYCMAMTIMAIIVLFVPAMMPAFGIGVLCTSLGDGFAGVFGRIKKYNVKIYGNKTFFGSLSCFVFSLSSIFLISQIYKLNIKWYLAVVIALFATELELFAKKGIDNITITVGVSFLSFVFAYYPSRSFNYVIPLLLTLPIIVFVHQKMALSKWGILVAIILDVIASIAFGNVGFLILIMFFLGSLVADRIKRQDKEGFERRGVKQVLANGALGIVFAIIYLIFPSKAWFVGYCAVFAESFADTVSSGIGSKAKTTLDPFRLKCVEKGTSGGMSIIGTVSAFFASSIIASISIVSDEIAFIDAVIILTTGFLGSIFDSFLGSVFQIKYKCKTCGKITERESHCDSRCDKYSGFVFITNNTVNFASTAFSAAFAAVIFAFF